MNRNLSNITAADLKSAGKQERGNFGILSPGKHVAKVLTFVEEDHYNYVSVEVAGKKYNFFYNYFLKDTTTFDADVLNWIIGLATVPVTDTTSLIEITNSAIGHSYEIEIYNYTPKSGKNAGKPQHGIQYSVAPKEVVATVEEEDFEFPY